MQSLLDSWLKIKNSYKNIFYLDWEKKEIKWLDNFPKKNFSVIKKWNKREIMVCGNFPDEKIGNYKSIYNNTGLLKSHLQKCVRRGNILSVNTAFELLIVNYTELLRRLPIIVIEDVSLTWNYDILIWLMMCNDKNIIYRPSVINWILSYIKALTLFNKKTKYFKREEKVKYDNLSKEKRSIIWSLEIRKDYGGMKGDMALLNGVIWHYVNNNTIYELNLEPMANFPHLELKDWELAAIDFHCSDIINKLCSKYNYPYYLIKKLMWNCRSSTNFRTHILPLSLDEYNLWNDIKDEVDKISKEILSLNYFVLPQ